MLYEFGETTYEVKMASCPGGQLNLTCSRCGNNKACEWTVMVESITNQDTYKKLDLKTGHGRRMVKELQEEFQHSKILCRRCYDILSGNREIDISMVEEGDMDPDNLTDYDEDED